MVGLTMAMLAGSAIWAAEVGGSLSRTTAFPPALAPRLEELFGLAAVVLLLGSGAHRPALRLLANSYHHLPLGGALAADLGPGAIQAGRAILGGGFALAAPVLATGLVARLLAASVARAGVGAASTWPEASITSWLAVGGVALVLLSLDTATLQLYSESLDQLPDLLRWLADSP